MLSFKLFADEQLSAIKCTAILAVYAIVAFTGILHHELGLDEAHQFLVGLWSNSLHQLYLNARYDGHPMIWFLLVFIVTRFGSDPLYVQALNVVLCCTAVWIFLRYAPFSLLFKLLFISGYFMIYEYSIISRNYGLACLLLFAVLALYRNRAGNPALFALSVALLANAHLITTIIASALLAHMLLEYFYSGEQKNRGQIFFASCIMLLGIVFALLQVIPPGREVHSSFASLPFPFIEQARKVCASPFRGIFNFPNISTYYCWNTNLFTDRYWNLTRILLPLPFVIAFILLAKKPFALFFFFLSVFGIMLIEYVGLETDNRQTGFIYLSFITSLWMARYETDSPWLNGIAWLTALTGATLKPAKSVLWLILILQVLSGGILYAKDFCQPFSESKETSNFLTENHLQHCFIMVSNQSLAPPVSAYLHRSVFHAEADRLGAFCYWNIFPWSIPDSVLISRVNGQLAEHDSIVLLLDHALDLPINQTGKTSLLKTFNHAFVKSANYRVYLVERGK
jgi:hypothetical protein